MNLTGLAGLRNRFILYHMSGRDIWLKRRRKKYSPNRGGYAGAVLHITTK